MGRYFLYRNSMRPWIIPIATLALTLTGCDPMPAPRPSASESLAQSDWNAETINGKTVIEAGRVTLSFVEDRVSGRSGCNLYSAPVEVGHETIKVGPLISTKMACLGNGLMQQESEYLATLGAATTYQLKSDSHLYITTPTGGALAFASAPRQKRPE